MALDEAHSTSEAVMAAQLRLARFTRVVVCGLAVLLLVALGVTVKAAHDAQDAARSSRQAVVALNEAAKGRAERSAAISKSLRDQLNALRKQLGQPPVQAKPGDSDYVAPSKAPRSVQPGQGQAKTRAGSTKPSGGHTATPAPTPKPSPTSPSNTGICLPLVGCL